MKNGQFSHLLGSVTPIAPQTFAACRKVNRRVPFKILEMNGKTLSEDVDPQAIEVEKKRP